MDSAAEKSKELRLVRINTRLCHVIVPFETLYEIWPIIRDARIGFAPLGSKLGGEWTDVMEETNDKRNTEMLVPYPSSNRP